MLTCHLSIHLEKKISFCKGVCSERTLGNEKTSICPETLVELKFRVGGLLIQTLIELILVFDRIDFCRSKRPSIETTFDRTDLHSRSTIILIVHRYKELFLKHVVVFPLLEMAVCYDVCHNILRLWTFFTSNNTLCPTNKLNKLDFGNNLC